MMNAIWGPNDERRGVFALALRGRHAEALERLDEASLQRGPSTYLFALTGQSEAVLATMERTGILHFRVFMDPVFDPARTHPMRFEQIVEQVLGHDVTVPRERGWSAS
jgi:hypothetical protein